MDFDFEKNMNGLDSLEGVPEEYQGFYAKGTDGKFSVTDAWKGAFSALAGLSKSLRGSRKEAADLKKNKVDLKPWMELAALIGVEGDVTPETFRAGIEAVLEKVKSGGDIKVNMEKIRKEIQTKADETIAAKDGEIAGMNKAFAKHMIEAEATRAIAAEKGVPELLLPIVRTKAKVVKDGEDYVVRVLDDAGEVRGDGKGGWMTVESIVKELKASKSYGRAFESEQKGGGGTPPGGAHRPGQPQQGERSANDKIAAGLKQRGVGA